MPRTRYRRAHALVHEVIQIIDVLTSTSTIAGPIRVDSVGHVIATHVIEGFRNTQPNKQYLKPQGARDIPAHVFLPCRGADARAAQALHIRTHVEYHAHPDPDPQQPRRATIPAGSQGVQTTTSPPLIPTHAEHRGHRDLRLRHPRRRLFGRSSGVGCFAHLSNDPAHSLPPPVASAFLGSSTHNRRSRREFVRVMQENRSKMLTKEGFAVIDGLHKQLGIRFSSAHPAWYHLGLLIHNVAYMHAGLVRTRP
ncbi:hypothetical protein C8T65DRAFT_745459 [Cerioporus squamosus]|nr:hypothetical protein C8T65DRAFT_745459 [Cerioporus squamosus]